MNEQVKVAPITGFSAAYDTLWEQARSSYAMCVRRDAALGAESAGEVAQRSSWGAWFGAVTAVCGGAHARESAGLAAVRRCAAFCIDR